MSGIIEAARDGAPFIAVVGMSGRFPRARDLDTFWKNIAEGRECISRFTPEELAETGVPEALRDRSDFVPARAILDEPFHFDAPFFGLTPREAELTDPQQRLFLECAWEALEHAGYDPTRYPEPIGVYAGADANTYVQGNLLLWTHDLQSLIGNDKDYLATRVSYKLNLRGPGVTIQTACSTSLVAVQLACQGLLGFQCDLALAGGVGVAFPQKAGYLYQKGGILSPDGHCRPFDARAQGTVGGDGVGVVVLKRLKDALEAGDTIHAVIRGAAINNDGSQKVGFTAPSVEGQAEVISLALAMADVPPETITYVEAHGTATELGDPVELTALTDAHRAHTDKKGYCAIGSLKSNVGHMNSAAGIGGLLKTIQALRHGQLPPSLHFETPSPMIDFASSPFYVNTRLRPWEVEGAPRRAGVSSFGVGGTNAHVILEEAPQTEPSGASRPVQLLVLSARTGSALEAATRNLVAHLEARPEQPLADVAHTLLTGRQRFKHRRMVVCRTAEEAREALLRAPATWRESRRAPVAFLFPGQGAQHVNMGRELYETETLFRREVDACTRFLEPLLGLDLRRVLYPEPGHEDEAARELTQTRLAQPALFVLGYALARLWMSWGLRPESMLGHSVGEYVAACLSGVMSRDDALRLIALRGKLVQRLPPGAMLAVTLPEEEATRLPGVCVAALNAPGMTVLSGPLEAIEAVERQLLARGVGCTRLHTSHAFHSPMMDPAVDELRGTLVGMKLSAPEIPFISNVTGTWISAAEAKDPGYWARHLRQPVRFSEGVAELLSDPDRVLLEVGPGRTLGSLVGRHGEKARERLVLASLGHPRERTSDLTSLLEALGRLYLSDVDVDWGAFYEDERRHRVPLPTYPFERQRYVLETARPLGEALQTPLPTGKRPKVGDWLYGPSWKRSLAASAPLDASERWLLFGDGSPLASALAERLARAGAGVVTVSGGEALRRLAPDRYELDPTRPEHYEKLLEELSASGQTPGKILHSWSLPSGRSAETTLREGFFSVLHLAQALARRASDGPVRLGIVTSEVAGVLGDEPACPEKATLLGLGQVISQELAHVRARTLDVTEQAVATPGAKLVERLLGELGVDTDEPVVALRGAHRWTSTFEPVRPRESTVPRLRERGVYLLVGGLGGIGMTLATHLARTVKARLVLTGRSGLVAPSEWDAWLRSHSEEDRISRKIRKVRELEALGAEVLVLSADVSDERQMANVVERARQRFGELHGVIHAAGVVGAEAFRAIVDTAPAHCDVHFRPKLRGLAVLDKVLPETLDFCLLCSSISTVLGGVGFAAYAAAAHAMDAFARARNARGGGRWLSVNWDAWQSADGERGAPGLLDSLALRPDEGAQAFQAVLSMEGPEQLLVSTMELGARKEHLQRMKEASRTRARDSEPASPKARHARPALETPFVAPRTAMEELLADLWRTLLGIENIGVDDNFFQLGGDSLMAIQLGTRLRDTLGIDVPINELFDIPTIAGLAARLEKLQQGNKAQQASLDATLAMVESLSDEEVKKLLAELGR